MPHNRRTFIVGATGLLFSRTAVAAVLTPPQTAGPFYPESIPSDHDIDLTQIAGRSGKAQGDVMELSGRVLSARGWSLGGGSLEIWQANAFGRYAHARDRGGRESDPNFQGYASVRLAGDGAFRFRTIKPAFYMLGGGNRRTPHIHFRVVDGEGNELVTQMYFPGEALNDDDVLFLRLGSDEARRAATAQADGAGRYRFDIVVV